MQYKSSSDFFNNLLGKSSYDIVHGKINFNRTSLKKKFNRKMKRVVLYELVDQNQENQNEQ